jgi:hypothetical protein
MTAGERAKILMNEWTQPIMHPRTVCDGMEEALAGAIQQAEKMQRLLIASQVRDGVAGDLGNQIADRIHSNAMWIGRLGEPPASKAVALAVAASAVFVGFLIGRLSILLF